MFQISFRVYTVIVVELLLLRMPLPTHSNSRIVITTNNLTHPQ